MTTPTPRTDAEVYSCPDDPFVSADFARALERELAQAHSENEEQARLLDMSATREAKLRADLASRDALIQRILDYPYLPQRLATIIRKEMDK